jgi:hypothetical protein
VPRHFVRLAFAASVLFLSVAVGGCVSAPSSRSDQGLVWGYVASAQDAQLVADTQKSSILAVVLSKVVAPEAAWVCVYENDRGVVGKMVGQILVRQGVTTNVEIPLDPLKSDKVFVLMHSDRGKPGVFEFDPKSKDNSPDRPVFVDGVELSVPMILARYGVRAAPGTAKIAVYRQGSIGSTVTVGSVLAPTDSWIVVQQQQNGRPGKVIGIAPVPAGSLVDYPVGLESGPPQGNFFVTLFADAGVRGKFEFSPTSPLTSPDQPYYVDGVPVTAEVPVKK